MRRFDYDDNEEYREDVDNFFDSGDSDEGITPEEYRSIVKEEQAMQQMQLHLVNRELNDRLMFKTIKMLESGFWWKFYSVETKLRMIEKAYRRIKKINEKG